MIVNRKSAFVLIACILACSPYAYAQEELPGETFRELQWLHPAADALTFLAESPRECLRDPDIPAVAHLVEMGRASFRNPYLFGGLAARNGLSCASCHRGGHDNPDFFAAGLSGDPGTADVTTALFSKVRDDGVFNPRKIPALVDAADKRAEPGQARAHFLREFISSAVTDEFQGAAPGDIVSGLVAYTMHLDSAFCVDAAENMSLAQAMDDIRRALRAAANEMQAGDGDTSAFLLLGIQNDLRLIHERCSAPGLERRQKRIEKYSRWIARWRASARTDPASAAGQTEEAFKKLEKLERRLAAHEGNSYYDRANLAALFPRAPVSGD